MNPHQQTMRMAKELNLTADQTAKVEPILADRDQKLATLRADTSLDPKSAKKQLHAIQQNTQQQLGAILTPAQADQLKALHAHGGKGQTQPFAVSPTA